MSSLIERCFFITSPDEIKVDKYIENIRGTYWHENNQFDLQTKDIIKQYKNKYYEKISHYYSHHLTLNFFEKIWIKNIYRNLNYILSQQNKNIQSSNLFKNKERQYFGKTDELKEIYKNWSSALIANKTNRRVHIVGAGPSLYSQIKALKEISNTLDVIIAVDTALVPLMQNEIEPDIILSLDAGFYNTLDFLRSKKINSILVTDIVVHPLVLRSCKKVFFLPVKNGKKFFI